MLLQRLSLTSLSTNIKLRGNFFYNVFEWLSLTLQFAASSHWAWQFLNTEISQGSVAIPLRCGGIFKNDFIANYQFLAPGQTYTHTRQNLYILAL